MKGHAQTPEGFSVARIRDRKLYIPAIDEDGSETFVRLGYLRTRFENGVYIHVLATENEHMTGYPDSHAAP